MLEDNLEHDCYFDLPSESLKSEHKSLCIRVDAAIGDYALDSERPEKDRCEAVNITEATKAKVMPYLRL